LLTLLVSLVFVQPVLAPLLLRLLALLRASSSLSSS
jgi:hypothetical protein